ncbi:hypothetical protein K502DRAFT_274429, partial [Neoconidiobolus thromboides FSU 785]
QYYQRLVHFSKTNPVITLTITNMGLAAIADITAQSVANLDKEFNIVSHQPFDSYRFMRFVLYQGAFAPICYKWYSILDKSIPVKMASELPSNTKKFSSFQNIYQPVLKRVFADQLFFAPLAVGCFFLVMPLLEGGNWLQIKTKFNELYYPTLLDNWKVWPLFQLVNFCYVPLFFRLPFASIMGIFWNTYLSMVNAQ